MWVRQSAAWSPPRSLDGAYLSPVLMHLTGMSLIRARQFTVLAGAAMMICPACISLAPNAFWAIALFSIGGFAHQVLSGALITLSADVFLHHQVATANGMTGTAAWTGGLLFSLLIGALAILSVLTLCLRAWQCSMLSEHWSSGRC
jgi:ACS family hexuronate transporter-like MFS transporter